MASVTWDQILNMQADIATYRLWKQLGMARKTTEQLGHRLKGTVWQDTARRDKALDELRDAYRYIAEAEGALQRAYTIARQDNR